MGANPTQALGTLLFMLALVLFSAGIAGGGVVLYILAAASLAGSIGVLLRAKPWENVER